MNTLLRWGKFNLVGAIGMALQLGVLAALNQFLHNHYLLATAVAIEVTLVHNFIWHLRFTWRDRHDPAAVKVQLLRFHLCNGLVSMLGNLALMRILVERVHLPVVVANCIAIVCCSFANFWLGNIWAFTSKAPDCSLRTADLTEHKSSHVAGGIAGKTAINTAQPFCNLSDSKL